MKFEVDTKKRLDEWLAQPVPAVFQGQNLKTLSDKIAALPLTDCVFLGCDMAPSLIDAVGKANCVVIPPRRDLPFDSFTPGLYTPSELYDQFDPADPEASYAKCLDAKIYDSVYEKDAVSGLRKEKDVDVDVTLMRRVHDWSISDALDDLLKNGGYERCVAIMGGHDESRDSPTYMRTALLAMSLTQAGYIIATGGGPGLMEAANLGAFATGLKDPEAGIKTAISSFPADALLFNPISKWIKAAFLAWKAMSEQIAQEKGKAGRSIGIPTWFYGFEPPNVFSTDIAKYFENSIREEGMLAFARAGIVFADGNGGTVQEMFQDANQNYYRNYGNAKSPMILFDVGYWHPPAANPKRPTKPKAKPAFSLLYKLATEKKFDDYILLTDDPAEVLEFIKTHPPVA